MITVGMKGYIKKIAVAMSGGVDSSVAAMILKRKGYEVSGIFMQNWSEYDEQGFCSGERDFLDAQKAANVLDIPLKRVVFEKEYWNHVFSQLISGYENGVTPNPDTLCNKHIKFGALFDHVIQKTGADWLATGHYARIKYSPDGSVKLMKAADTNKDQTFFLGQVSQESLRRTLFPLGYLHKWQVKELAMSFGLEAIANKKESMGVCFIGKRQFRDFISEYVTTPPGDMIDIDTGKLVTKHQGIHIWTIGQRTLTSGQRYAYHVCEIDANTNTIYVAAGRNHPALDCTTFTCADPHWISTSHRKQFETERMVICWCRTMHGKEIVRCDVLKSDTGSSVTVDLIEPLSGIVAPGQFVVFYDGDECIGSALIVDKEKYHKPEVTVSDAG